MMIQDGVGRSGAGAPSGCQPTASAAGASSRSGIPNAHEALADLITAVETDAGWLADCLEKRKKAGDGELRRCALELVAKAHKALPSTLYAHQRAAMAVRDFTGNPNDDWRDYVPAAFAALLKTFETRTIRTPRADGAAIAAAFTVSADALEGVRCLACGEHVAAGQYHECWNAPASAMSGSAQDREDGLDPKGASAVPKGDAK